MRIRNRIILTATILCILVGSLFGCSKATSHCYLCGSPPHTAPCVVDLATGDIGELTISDNQGARSWLFAGSITITLDPWKAQAIVPTAPQAVNWDLYCENCQALIAQTPNHGFVLADLSKSGQPVLYSITLNADYTIRDYHVDTDASDRAIRISATKS